jgi:hypothetical protein
MTYRRRWLILSAAMVLAIATVCLINGKSRDRRPHPSRLARLFGEARSDNHPLPQSHAPEISSVDASSAVPHSILSEQNDQRRAAISDSRSGAAANNSVPSLAARSGAASASTSSDSEKEESSVVIKRPIAHVEELFGEWSAANGTAMTFAPDGRFSLNFEFFGETYAEGTYRFENGQVTVSLERGWTFEKDRWVRDDGESPESETAPLFLSPEGRLIIDDDDNQTFTKSPLEATKSPRDNG